MAILFKTIAMIISQIRSIIDKIIKYLLYLLFVVKTSIYKAKYITAHNINVIVKFKLIILFHLDFIYYK